MKAYELGEGVKVTFRICVFTTYMMYSLTKRGTWGPSTRSSGWVFARKEEARKALKREFGILVTIPSPAINGVGGGGTAVEEDAIGGVVWLCSGGGGEEEEQRKEG
ncbi:hypothetical protein L1987_44039 [Smallanthus sonchifolius]|uniref:Uncharacterized protein n=1 Tax=Smallanthus sonchifolius TaxID=185202 RepID=A0ACB9GPI5_9ASTR|nr:hypothetical protein L1987_44039 [Smallanthus sonchifolius]